MSKDVVVYRARRESRDPGSPVIREAVVGKRMSANFALTPVAEGDEYLGPSVLTHMGTGHAACYGLEGEKIARRIAKRFEPVLPWAEVTESNDPRVIEHGDELSAIVREEKAKAQP